MFSSRPNISFKLDAPLQAFSSAVARAARPLPSTLGAGAFRTELCAQSLN